MVESELERDSDWGSKTRDPDLPSSYFKASQRKSVILDAGRESSSQIRRLDLG